MELITVMAPEPAANSINTSSAFQHPLQELETYVSRSQNAKLTDSFRRFKEALSEPEASINDVPAITAAHPITAPPLPEREEHSYMAMSSLFSANVKHW